MRRARDTHETYDRAVGVHEVLQRGGDAAELGLRKRRAGAAPARQLRRAVAAIEVALVEAHLLVRVVDALVQRIDGACVVVGDLIPG